MMINTDVSRRRRQFYKRALTLSSIPPQLIPEVENETDEDEQSKLLKSPKHTVKTGEKNTIVLDEGNGTKTTLIKDGDSVLADVMVPADVTNKRALFQQRKSITISSDEPLLPLKDSPGKKATFSRSPTSPSAILAKFKDRIQQSLFITSTEWPSAAAILNDRRQKANEHAKATLHQKDLDIESIHMTELTKKRKRCRRSDTVGHAAEGESIENTDRFRRCRMKSDPIVYSVQKENTPLNDDTLPPDIDIKNRDAARDAFRRRSISEDTYDRLPTTFLKERKQIQASHVGGVACVEGDLSSNKSSNSGGIVCSNEDLQEILTCYKREKSPTSVVVSSQSSSDKDQGKCPRPSYTSQSSCTYSYSSQISETSTGSRVIDGSQDAFCDNFPKSYTRVSSASSSVHVYPEVILDSSKNQNDCGCSNTYYVNNVDLDCSGQKTSENDPDEMTRNLDDEAQQQPPEVRFDEYGQTWDVYGAEFDPEILGSAIQKHLEKLMNSNKTASDTTTVNQASGCSGSEQESRSKAFINWWRFLCLFGTNKQSEANVC